MIIVLLSVLGVFGIISAIFGLLEKKWYMAALSVTITGLVIFFAVRDTQGMDETVFKDCRVVGARTICNKVSTRVQLPDGQIVYAGGFIPTATSVDVKMFEYPLSGIVEYVVVINDELVYGVKLPDPEPPLPTE